MNKYLTLTLKSTLFEEPFGCYCELSGGHESSTFSEDVIGYWADFFNKPPSAFKADVPTFTEVEPLHGYVFSWNSMVNRWTFEKRYNM